MSGWAENRGRMVWWAKLMVAISPLKMMEES